MKAESGAEETQALKREGYIGSFMRVGTVVSYVSTSEIAADNAQRAAKVQVDRIRTVAAGGNPGH
ncbi:hypothetical protein ACPB9E_18030 [Streptomyces exfoliatus]|uniref:hypothetical protein n=1 Tax=Streptomyces exfoliatus TaxID=1905 RepID=UPI003C2F7CD9